MPLRPFGFSRNCLVWGGCIDFPSCGYFCTRPRPDRVSTDSPKYSSTSALNIATPLLLRSFVSCNFMDPNRTESWHEDLSLCHDPFVRQELSLIASAATRTRKLDDTVSSNISVRQSIFLFNHLIRRAFLEGEIKPLQSIIPPKNSRVDGRLSSRTPTPQSGRAKTCVQ
jgi:hypothetical protein